MTKLTARQRQILLILAEPHGYAEPRRWRGSTPWSWRHVYEGADGEWGITHSGDLVAIRPPLLTSDDVLPMFDAGLIASDYPGTKSAMSSFHITPAGRAAIQEEK